MQTTLSLEFLLQEFDDRLTRKPFANELRSIMKEHFGLKMLQIILRKCEIMEAALMLSQNR